MVGDFLEQVVPSLTHPILRCRNLILCQSQTTLCCVSFTEAAHGPRTFHSIQGIFVSTTPDIETGSEIERKASSQPASHTARQWRTSSLKRERRTKQQHRRRSACISTPVTSVELCSAPRQTDRQQWMDAILMAQFKWHRPGCFHDYYYRHHCRLELAIPFLIAQSLIVAATASRAEKGDDDEREKERKTQKKQNMIL